MPNNDIALGDFNISRQLHEDQTHALTLGGTKPYKAPEIINEEDYRFSVDVWSLGLVLYELLTLRPNPYCIQKNYLNLKQKKLYHFKISDHYGDVIKEILHKMLVIDKFKRCSV